MAGVFHPAWNWRNISKFNPTLCSRCIMFFGSLPKKFNIDTKKWWALEKMYIYIYKLYITKRVEKIIWGIHVKFQGCMTFLFWHRKRSAPKASRQKCLHLHGSALGLATNGASEGLLEGSPSRRTAINKSVKLVDLCVALEIDLAVATLRHTHSVHGTLV